MRDTYSLGRIAGIGIGLHWSVLVLLGLLMWTLATAIFPDTNPGLGDGVYFLRASGLAGNASRKLVLMRGN